MNLNNNTQHCLPSSSSTSHPSPPPANRSLYRSPQARLDLHRDLPAKWYYKKVSSIHNGALVRQEYRVTWVEPPIPIGPNYDPQDLLHQLDRADGSLDNRLSLPSLPPMGLPSLPVPACDPTTGMPPIACPPAPFAFSAPIAQGPPPPYTPAPVQSTVTTVAQPPQLNNLGPTVPIYLCNCPICKGNAQNL